MSDDAPSGLHLELSRSLPSLASGKTYSDIEHKKREGRKASIKQIGTKIMECSFELAIRGTPYIGPNRISSIFLLESHAHRIAKKESSLLYGKKLFLRSRMMCDCEREFKVYSTRKSLYSRHNKQNCRHSHASVKRRLLKNSLSIGSDLPPFALVLDLHPLSILLTSANRKPFTHPFKSRKQLDGKGERKGPPSLAGKMAHLLSDGVGVGKNRRVAACLTFRPPVGAIRRVVIPVLMLLPPPPPPLLQ